ncbi:MAG: RNB domain-containing ribonuclease [Myxococcales bacterium]|nr:RNB domain-containing ribonuclease [Myxococcales bacterium]
MNVGDLCLVRHQDALVLVRVAAVRVPAFFKAQMDTPAGVQVVALDGQCVAAKLSAQASTWLQVQQRAAGARGRSQTGDIETAWTLLLDQPCGTGEVARLLYGSDGPQQRDDALLTVGLADDAFYLESGQLVPRRPQDRRSLGQTRDRHQHLCTTLTLWQATLRQLDEGQRPTPSQSAEMVGQLQNWLVQPTTAPLASAWLEVDQVAAEQQTRAVSALLLRLGAFDPHDDPQLVRLAGQLPKRQYSDEPPDFPSDAPRSPLPWVTIDNDAPHEIDDAVAVTSEGDGWRVAVAIAHPACWFGPEDAEELVARTRGATLYHPRLVCPMLAAELSSGVASLAAGKWRPSLVFSAYVATDGGLSDWQVHEQWVCVRAAWRYSVVDSWLAGSACAVDEQQTLDLLWKFTQLREKRRIADGAWLLYKPEVDVHAPRFETVQIVDASQSSPARRIVTEAMILAGIVSAAVASDHRLPMPFRCQPPPIRPPITAGLYTDAAEVFSLLRCMQPSVTQVEPGSHSIMAVPHYCQVTSPLRRYCDIIAHRQLMALLRGRRPYDAVQVRQLLAVSEPEAGKMRHWQRQADRYFKLLHLAGRPAGSQWPAQIVRTLASGVLAFIPALALELPLRNRKLPVGQSCTLVVKSADPFRDRIDVAVI